MQLRRFILSSFLLLVYFSGYAHNFLFYERESEHACHLQITEQNNSSDHLLLHHLSEFHLLDVERFLLQISDSAPASFWEFLFEYLIELHDPDGGCDLDAQLLPSPWLKPRLCSIHSSKNLLLPLLFKEEVFDILFAANRPEATFSFPPKERNSALFASSVSRRGPPCFPAML